MDDRFARSAPGRFLNRIGALPVRLLRRFAAGKGQGPGKAAPYQWFLAAGTALMLCVPHEQWNNLYGLLFALAALAVYWWDCAARGREPLPVTELGAGIWGFALVVLAGVLWANSAVGHVRTAVFYFTGFLLCYLTAASSREEAGKELLLRGIFAALVITSLYGLGRYFFGREAYYVPMDGRLYARLGSTLEHGINYSEFIAMAFPVCLVYALTRPGKKKLWGLALLPSIAALALTYARTGWVALAFAVFVLACMTDRRLAAPMLVLGVLGLFCLPGSVKARLLSMLQFSDAASSGRFTLWSECLRMLRDRWLIGVGLGQENFTPAYLPYSTGVLDFTPPHANMGYLEMALSTGILGFGFFCAFFFGIFVRLAKALRRTDDRMEKRLLRALTAALAGAAIANVPEHIWFYPRILFFWCVLYGLALGMTMDRETVESVD